MIQKLWKNAELKAVYSLYQLMKTWWQLVLYQAHESTVHLPSVLTRYLIVLQSLHYQSMGTPGEVAESHSVERLSPGISGTVPDFLLVCLPVGPLTRQPPTHKHQHRHIQGSA